MKKQSFLYGSVILMLSALVVKAIGAVFRIPLTNMLGGTGMGIFSCAYGFFLPVYAVSVTGLPVAIAKMVAESSVKEDYIRVRRIFSVSLRVFSLSGLLFTTLIILLSDPICSLWIGIPDAAPAVRAIAPSVFLGCICAVYRGYYEGLRNMYPTALSQVAEALAKLVIGLGSVLMILRLSENSPEAISISMQLCGFTGNPEESLIPFCATAAVFGVTLSSLVGTLFLVLRKKLGGDGISYSMLGKGTELSEKTILSELMKTAVPIALGSLVTTLTSLIDLLTVTRCVKSAVLSSPADFSVYGLSPDETAGFLYGSFNGLAITVFNLVPSLTNMFGKGAIPSVSEAYFSRNREKLADSVTSAISATAFLAIPAGLGIYVLSPQILRFLFSSRTDEILAATESMRWLGLAVIPVALTFPVFSVFQAVGRADIPLKAMLAGVVTKLIGNILLVPVPEINIAGAGISTLFCYSEVLAISLFLLFRVIPTHLPLLRRILPSAVGGAACAVTAHFLCPALSSKLPEALAIVISVAISGCIHLIFTLLIVHFAKTSTKYKKN